MSGNNSTTMPLVSIIMNCYNGEKYLEEAIDSVLAQSYSNWELVFWDNQSSDESAEIFKKYNDSRLKYFFADAHTLLGEARNKAVLKGKGDWIAFLDCDDLWVNTKLEKQLDLINSSKKLIGLVYTKTEYFCENSVVILPGNRESLPTGDIFLDLIQDNFISLSSALINKKVFYELGTIDSTLNQAEEYNIFVKIAYKYPILVSDEILTKYRIHDNNLSISQKDLAFIESIKTLEIFKSDSRTIVGLNYWSSLFLLSSVVRMKISKDVILYFLKYGSVIKLINLGWRFFKYRFLKNDFINRYSNGK